MANNHPPYAAEFGQQMAKPVQARPPAELAREFDVTAQAITSPSTPPRKISCMAGFPPHPDVLSAVQAGLAPGKVAATVLLLLLTVSQPAFASQTACVFSTGKAADYYELEFIGDSGTKPLIVFSSTAFGDGRRITLDAARYRLTRFDQKTGKVQLQFRNRRDPSLPHSFSLAGNGGRARLSIGARHIDGEMQCKF